MVRDNGVSVRLANGGMWVYLYDQSSAQLVRDALDEVPQSGEETATVLDLARRGVLVKCELRDQAPLYWEFAEGGPLTAQEKKVAKWMRVIRVPLGLPSGMLVVETDATRSAPEQHPPATIRLSAGMRELTLHMADRDNMGEPKYARYDGPDAVVTLRPWPSKKKHRPRIGAIFYARDAQAANAFEGGPRAPWDGRYHLDGGVFVGEVIATSDSLAARWSSPGEHRMICNLDGSAFNRLELRRGQRLSVSIAGRNYTVLSLGRWHPKRAEAFLGKRAYAGLADRHPRLLVGFLSGTRIIGEPGFVATYHEYGVPYRWHDYFVVGTLSPDSEGYRAEDASFQTIFRAQPGSPVRLSVEPAPFFGVDASWRDAWKAEGQALHARVVSCTEAALFLNIDRRALAQIGFADGDVLELRIGDLTRTIYDKKYIAARDWLDIMERITRPRPESQAARAAEIEKMLYDESGRIRPEDELPTGPDLLRELNRLEFHPDDLAAPPLTLDFVENLDVEGWMMTALTSALRTTVFDPDDIHIDVPPDTPVTLAPAQ